MHVKNRDLLLHRHPIGAYFVITFVVTIILGAAYQFTNNPFISPQYAPTIGSITLLQDREGALFYALAIIISLLICIPLVIRNKDEFYNLQGNHYGE